MIQFPHRLNDLFFLIWGHNTIIDFSELEYDSKVLFSGCYSPVTYAINHIDTLISWRIILLLMFLRSIKGTTILKYLMRNGYISGKCHSILIIVNKLLYFIIKNINLYISTMNQFSQLLISFN